MNKNSVSEFDKAENQKVQPEAVQKRNREFTDKFDIPIIADSEKQTDDEDTAVTQAKDISTGDKPSKIIKNPENNIRYMKKEAENNKKLLKAEFLSGKNSSGSSVLSKISEISEAVKLKKENHRRRKRGSQRLDIEIKSTPDTDFFSMTFDELKTFPKDDENKKSSADNIPEIKSHIEDYEKPEDSDSIFHDIQELKASLHTRIITLVILSVLCAYITLADTNDFPIFSALKSSVSPQGFIFIQIIMGIVALALSFTMVLSGIKKLFKRHADCDSMAAVSIISSLIAAAAMLIDTQLLEKGQVYIYICIGIVSLLFNTIGKYLIADRAMRNFEFVSDDSRKKYAMFCVDNEDTAEKLAKGCTDDYPVVAAARKTDFLKDFLKYTYSSDIADKFCMYAVPAFTAISFILSLLLPLVNRSAYSGSIAPVCFSVFAMCMSLCSCMAVSIVVNLPLDSVSREYSETSGLMLGYQSVEDFYDVNAIMACSPDLFPENSVILAGIKMFSDSKIDDAIIDAGSLAIQSESILEHMFLKIADGKKDIFRSVESCSYEDKCGVSGWISNRRILLGNRQLMEKHSIEGLPLESVEAEYTKNGHDVVYLSVSGNLAAAFIVKLKADPEVKYWTSEMAEHKIKLIIKNSDSLVTAARLSQVFDIPEEYFKVLDSDCHEDFDLETHPAPSTSASMAHEGDISTMIKLITDSGNLRRNFVAGMIMQCAASVLGIILASAFICMNSVQNFNPSIILGYNLAWTLITSALVKSRIF